MKAFFSPIFVLLFASCSGLRVFDTDTDPGFKLSNYKTFDFYKLEATGDTIPVNFADNADIMKASITKHLIQKGLQPSPSNPDLLVNIGIVVEEKIQTRETDFRDRTLYTGQRNYSWKSEEIEVGRYKQGTATVHLVDAHTNKLVWKSSVDGVVPENPKVPAMIEEGMTALFEKLQ